MERLYADSNGVFLQSQKMMGMGSTYSPQLFKVKMFYFSANHRSNIADSLQNALCNKKFDLNFVSIGKMKARVVLMQKRSV